MLLVAAALVFGQTARHEFVNIDDNECVYQNKEITDGLSRHGIEAAFTKVLADNWVPLTCISHMLDWQAYENDAGGHHVTNVLLHAATVVLLFLVLTQMTGRMWASAAAAALFALHPLRAESVAWVTERKDVLSGLFFALTLWAYVGYVRHPSSLLRYGAVMAFLALGLMAKPMLVTLPFLLLLLDYWPLERMKAHRPIPGSVASAARKGPAAGRRGGLLADDASGAKRGPGVKRSPASRAAVGLFLGLLCRLSRPALFTRRTWRSCTAPDPDAQVLSNAAAALGILAGVTAIAVIWRRKCPYFLVGWLWYLGMLFPVSGVFGFGYGAAVDRQPLHVPAADRTGRSPGLGRGRSLPRLAAVALGVLRRVGDRAGGPHVRRLVSDVVLAISETLWTRAIACTGPNALAHYNLGRDLLERDHVDAARAEFQTGVEIRPNIAQIRLELGVALARRSTGYAEAIPELPGWQSAILSTGLCRGPSRSWRCPGGLQALCRSEGRV